MFQCALCECLRAVIHTEYWTLQIELWWKWSFDGHKSNQSYAKCADVDVGDDADDDDDDRSS